MKQLPMTPELIALIQSQVGVDVDPTDFAVFETIALNTRPLPGKNGSLFEKAVVQPITLKEMVDSINGGNHLPLIADHELMGAPKGRFFHAGLDYEDGLTMRALFYLDPTEVALIGKLNAGSLDEVSVAFLSREFNCSECGWDYFAATSSRENIIDRVCANGHEIGQNGVHGEMNGLNQFIELSLVARGAAERPKIVGKSDSKLAPATRQLLAAKGFEVNDLVVQASIGLKEDTMDLAALTAQLTSISTDKGQLTAEVATLKSNLSDQTATLTEVRAAHDTLVTELAAEKAKVVELSARPDAVVGVEHGEAVTFLQDQVNHLLVASGKPKLEGDAAITKVADLKAKISELTGDLTSILPIGGRSAGAAGNDDDNADKTAKMGYSLTSAFGIRK